MNVGRRDGKKPGVGCTGLQQLQLVSLQDRPMQRVVRRPVIFKGSPMKMQTISANDICHSHTRPPGNTGDRGIDLDELSSASLTGLVLASRKYDPQRGSFGVYAKFWMKGQITELFKKKKARKEVLLEEPVSTKEPGPAELPPPDLQDLNPTERRIISGRASGETLKEIGTELGFSAERARQLETRATGKLRRSKGKIALACIRDLVKSTRLPQALAPTPPIPIGHVSLPHL